MRRCPMVAVAGDDDGSSGVALVFLRRHSFVRGSDGNAPHAEGQARGQHCRSSGQRNHHHETGQSVSQGHHAATIYQSRTGPRWRLQSNVRIGRHGVCRLSRRASSAAAEESQRRCGPRLGCLQLRRRAEASGVSAVPRPFGGNRASRNGHRAGESEARNSRKAFATTRSVTPMSAAIAAHSDARPATVSATNTAFTSSEMEMF